MGLLGQAKKKLVSDGSRNSKGLPLQSLASVESLSVPLVQEVVLPADIQCAECEQRISDIMAKMTETESVIISLFEKKVTLIGKYSNPDNPPELQLTSTDHPRFQKIATYCCLLLKINVDCNACCRKMRRVILKMKVIERFLIEKQQSQVSLCGRFRPADVAIKIRKKMKRRVEILEVEELDAVNE